MYRVCLLLVLVTAVPLAVPARAQTAIYLDFSAANPENWIYGATLGAYHERGHLFFFKTGLDLRGSFLGNGSSEYNPYIFGVTAGPRFAYHPRVVPLTPYLEALAGVGRVKNGTPVSTRFEYQIVGGLDLTILPRLDWRVFDWAYTGYPGLSVGDPYPGYDSGYAPRILSTGLVLRLP
ncbi:MAG: hypothetical protein ACR2JE_00610 [Acidobacteriaceae bacterium]